MRKQFIETGKIVGTHGIKGEIRVQPWSDSPEFLLEFKCFYLDENGCSKINIKSSRVHKNIVLMTIDGVESIEEAEKYRNKIIYMDRKDATLPEGSHFIEDLIDCEVFDSETGDKLGTLCDVSKTGANDVWHIKDEKGREYLVPAIPDVVDSVDVVSERIIITPLKGIFDDED